ncbi:hypothetical protein TKK_0014664 [Trichogramma kaykai]
MQSSRNSSSGFNVRMKCSCSYVLHKNYCSSNSRRRDNNGNESGPQNNGNASKSRQRGYNGSASKSR